MEYHFETGSEVNEGLESNSEQLSENVEVDENFDDCSLSETEEYHEINDNVEESDEVSDNFDDCDLEGVELEEREASLEEYDDAEFDDCSQNDGFEINEKTEEVAESEEGTEEIGEADEIADEVETEEIDEINEETEEVDETEEVIEKVDETEEAVESEEGTEEIGEADETADESEIEETDEINEEIGEVDETEEAVESKEVAEEVAESEEGTEEIGEADEIADESEIEETDEINEETEKVDETEEVIEKVDETEEVVESEEVAESEEGTEEIGEADEIADEVETEEIDEINEEVDETEEAVESEEVAEEVAESEEDSEEIGETDEIADEVETEEIDEINDETDEVVETEEVAESEEGTEEIGEADEIADESEIEEIDEINDETEEVDETEEAVESVESEEVIEEVVETDEVVEEIGEADEIADEVETEETEESEKVENSEVVYDIDKILNDEKITTEEIDALYSENIKQINEFNENQQTLELDCKEKFDNVLKYEKGTEEYETALSEYNNALSKKERAAEYIAELNENNSKLEQKKNDLMERGIEAKNSIIETPSKIDMLNEMRAQEALLLQERQKIADNIAQISESGDPNGNLAKEYEKLSEIDSKIADVSIKEQDIKDEITSASRKVSERLDGNVMAATELHNKYEDIKFSDRVKPNDIKAVIEENSDLIELMQQDEKTLEEAINLKLDEMRKSANDDAYRKLFYEYNNLIEQKSKLNYNINNLTTNNQLLEERMEEIENRPTVRDAIASIFSGITLGKGKKANVETAQVSELSNDTTSNHNGIEGVNLSISERFEKVKDKDFKELTLDEKNELISISVDNIAEKYSDRVSPKRIEMMKEHIKFVDVKTVKAENKNCDPMRILGYYSPSTDEIKINIDAGQSVSEMIATIDHECMHMASQQIDVSEHAVGNITGVKRADLYKKNVGMNEGITEMYSINNMHDFNPEYVSGSYPRQVKLMRQYEEICGKDKILNAYFNNDISIMENDYDLVMGKDSFRKFCIEMDEMYSAEESKNFYAADSYFDSLERKLQEYKEKKMRGIQNV